MFQILGRGNAFSCLRDLCDPFASFVVKNSPGISAKSGNRSFDRLFIPTGIALR
jgi:hypothetical protein